MNQQWHPMQSLVLLQASVLIVGCGVIGTIWRMTNLTAEHDEQVLAEQKRFHAESVAALTQLATNAGLLTSADLCPVRFRLRSGGGHSIPILAGGEAEFRLWARSEAGRESIMKSRMDAAGCVDFGLNAPGPYEVEMRMPDGMFLLHRFEVVPGIPVDRMVCCPQTAIPVDVRAEVNIAWPRACAAKGLVAVCRIEPAPFVHGEWNWQPAIHSEPLWVVVPMDATTPIEGIATNMNLSDSDLRAADELLVSFRYCQVSEIAFLVCEPDVTGTGSKWTHLVTSRFGNCRPDNGQAASIEPILNMDLQPLQFTTARRPWRIELPQQVTDLLQQHVGQVSDQ